MPARRELNERLPPYVHKATLILLSLLTCICGANLKAADYPTRPITLVVGFPPGDSTDLVARIVAKALSERLAVPVLVENRLGATGTIGAAYVASAAPNGYTLLMSPNANLTVLPHVMNGLRYDAAKSFVSVGFLARTPPTWLCINPEVPVTSLRELIDYIKARPGKLNFGSSGIGSLSHIAGSQLRADANLDIVHIPYAGSNARMRAILSGETHIGFFNLPTPIEFMRAGKLRCLASSGDRRTQPDLEMPTFKENGFNDFIYDTWFTVLAPAGTPKSIVERLESELAQIAQSPAEIDALSRQGIIEVRGPASQEVDDMAQRERDKFHALIQRLAIKTQN